MQKHIMHMKTRSKITHERKDWQKCAIARNKVHAKAYIMHMKTRSKITHERKDRQKCAIARNVHRKILKILVILTEIDKKSKF